MENKIHPFAYYFPWIKYEINKPFISWIPVYQIHSVCFGVRSTKVLIVDQLFCCVGGTNTTFYP